MSRWSVWWRRAESEDWILQRARTGQTDWLYTHAQHRARMVRMRGRLAGVWPAGSDPNDSEYSRYVAG